MGMEQDRTKTLFDPDGNEILEARKPVALAKLAKLDYVKQVTVAHSVALDVKHINKMEPTNPNANTIEKLYTYVQMTLL